LDGNQAWWESLGQAQPGRPVRRTPYKSGGVKLFAMTCGWLSSDLGMMLAGLDGKIRFPVPAYLIEHPKGRVLFDTGMHPQSQHDAMGRIGELAKFFHVEFRPGEDIKSRLEQLDVDADRIEYVINSHLHFDHTGGNELLPNARIYIQEREWEAGHTPELVKANAYNPNDYEHGHLIRQVNGELDLFGDGTVVSFPTFGHTPGHQSLKVKLTNGDIVLAADACYLRQTLENLHLPGLVHDRAQMIDSLFLLRRLQSAGARIFYGHDPSFWRQVPQAPLEVV
jgi:glyoxylase-like metal-dependent hydrolase (beta-lactamase superfamily II)